MQIKVGYELVYRCPRPTPMVVTLSIHYSRISDLIKADHLVLTPSIPVTAYRDSFGSCLPFVDRRKDGYRGA